MIPDTCIQIETKKFPVLEGEEEELFNEGMYGKALCLYLEKELPKLGIQVPSFCCEDWGWWVEVNADGFKMGLCVYSDPELEDKPTRYAIMPSIENGKKWVWSKFRKIDVTQDVVRIMDTVEKLFRDDDEITDVSRHDDYPF